MSKEHQGKQKNGKTPAMKTAKEKKIAKAEKKRTQYNTKEST